MNDLPRLDVVVSIVNHNSVDSLRVCLPTVLSNVAGLSAEVWVVDNLCADRAAPMLAAEFPQVRVLSNNEVKGFGANHNQVLHRATSTSRYVLVLNPDTHLPPGALRRMVTGLDTSPRTAVLGVTVAHTDGTIQSLPRQVINLPRDLVMLTIYVSDWPGMLAWLERIKRRLRRRSAGHGQTVTPPSAKPKEAQPSATPDAGKRVEVEARHVVSGAAMLMRSEALQTVGLFDENFFLFFEEYDWFYRARRAGWEVSAAPEVVITHVGGQSTSRHDYYYYFLIRLDSWLRFYEKHGGAGQRLVLAAWLKTLAHLNLARLAMQTWLRPARARHQERRRGSLLALLKQTRLRP